MNVDWLHRLRPPRVPTSRLAIFLFVLLQLYFVSNTLSFGFWRSGDAVFGYMLVFFGAWIGGLVLVLSIILAVSRRLDSPWLAVAALVVLSVPFSLELWIQSIEISGTAIQRAVQVLVVPAMYFYFRVGLERVRGTSCAIVLLSALSFAGHAGFSASTAPLQDFDTVELDKRTSVHVVMLDSLTPSSFSREFMGVDNPAADLLATLDDTIYADSSGFSENVPTKRAWGTLFNLGQRSRHPGFFSGATPSRLTVLLRENGYTISTGFPGDYFGWYKGEYVDHYYGRKIQWLINDLSCMTKTGKLGFCSQFSQGMFSRHFARKLEGAYKRKGEWTETVIDLIDSAERAATGPLFSAFHINLPGHTPGNYRSGDAKMFAEYRKQFVDGVHRARKVIEEVDRLRREYPKSIFIVSGDHGPFLSRKAGPDADRRFVVLDRHGVALALLNASNLCTWSRDWLATQRYLTASRMLAASLACNGESRRLTAKFADSKRFVRYATPPVTGNR